MQINTYDQPGVESGKIILKEKLKALKWYFELAIKIW
jgi:glucose-6-phosphate isomerase